MLKRLFHFLFGVEETTEKTPFDAAVDELNKTIDQLDRDIQIIRMKSDNARIRHQKLDAEWERFKQKLPTDNHENQDP